MGKWNSEEEAREQIKALVAEYYHDFKEKKEPYQPHSSGGIHMGTYPSDQLLQGTPQRGL